MRILMAKRTSGRLSRKKSRRRRWKWKKRMRRKMMRRKRKLCRSGGVRECVNRLCLIHRLAWMKKRSSSRRTKLLLNDLSKLKRTKKLKVSSLRRRKKSKILKELSAPL
jgi:hypothetical protein